MIYTVQTKEAMKLCFEAHKEQTDRAGLPYVFHPFHLAEQMKDEASTVAALLHDVVEDTSFTLEDLKKMRFPDESIQALKLLTHNEAEPYMEYVCRIACDPVARAVKLADLTHNSDLSRLEEITEKDRVRAAKYRMAKRLIKSTEAAEPGSKYLDITYTHYSKIWFSKKKKASFTIYASRDQIAGSAIDVETADEDYHYWYTRDAGRKLASVFGGELSLPQQLIDYLKHHEPYELEKLMAENRIEHEMHLYYDEDLELY